MESSRPTALQEMGHECKSRAEHQHPARRRGAPGRPECQREEEEGGAGTAGGDLGGKTSVLAVLPSVVTVLSCSAESHPNNCQNNPSYFDRSEFSDQMNWGTATFQILNPCSLNSPFVAHPCQHFLYFLFYYTIHNLYSFIFNHFYCVIFLGTYLPFHLPALPNYLSLSFRWFFYSLLIFQNH